MNWLSFCLQGFSDSELIFSELLHPAPFISENVLKIFKMISKHLIESSSFNFNTSLKVSTRPNPQQNLAPLLDECGTAVVLPPRRTPSDLTMQIKTIFS